MANLPHELLGDVCREILNVVPCDRIDLALPIGDGDTLKVTTLYPAETDPAIWELPREGSCCAEVLRKWKAELLPTLGSEFHFAEEEVLYRQGIRDAAFLPLRQGGDPYGVLILGASEPQCLEGRGIRLLERVSGVVTLAFLNASRGPASVPAPPGPAMDRSDEGIQNAYRQLLGFIEESNRIWAEDEGGEACRLFLKQVSEQTHYRRAILTLCDTEGRDRQWFFSGMSDEQIDAFHTHQVRPADREALLAASPRRGRSYLVRPGADGERLGLPPRTAGGDEAGPVLVIPLQGEGNRLVGLLILDDPAGDLEPAAEMLMPIELFAGQMARAIEKKRLDRAVKKAESGLRRAQEQLMQSEKMSAIGQLISGVTHELNNPLSGIIGYAQMLQNSDVGSKEKRDLGKIYSEAIRCQKIVQNLLGFARRHAPEKSLASLNQVIESVLELRSYQLQVDDVEVERRYDPDLPETMLDVHQLQQVVLNVVNNAHQAMMEIMTRSRRLTVATEISAGRVRARITDTGPGIPKNRLARIFDSFFTTKTAGKGTGLGLSLSRAIMDDHQGTIEAESQLGEGTTFLIELPLVAERRAEPPQPARTDSGGAARQPLELLVVDDEEILVELLCDFLRSVGHRVDQARNGRDALRLATERDYDLVLSDLKMPGLDGQGFYDRLCRKKPAMSGRFIFSTGDLANPKVQTFFQRTGVPYLSKPFRLEAVLEIVDQISARLRAA